MQERIGGHLHNELEELDNPAILLDHCGRQTVKSSSRKEEMMKGKAVISRLHLL
jgi:hypothetical protein